LSYPRGVVRPTLLAPLVLALLAACSSREERAAEALTQASDTLMAKNDPAAALVLYDRALELAEPGSEVWHSARWWRLHAVAGVDPDAVAGELERLLREDARRVDPLSILDLASKMCLAGEPAALEVFDRSMAVLGIPEEEHAQHRESLVRTLEIARTR
jgi:hypothetical protein